MSFAIYFLKTIGNVILAGSPERVFQRARDLKLDSRSRQLWLALSSVAFASSFLIYFLLPLSGPFLSLFSLISRGENPPEWLFWLGENSWYGLGFGMLVGALLRGVLRYCGFYFLFSGGMLLTGIVSLGSAWGIFLGGFLFGSLENFWRFSGKEFRLRSGISLAFGLGGLLLAPLVSILVSNLAYSVQLRWLQWLFLVFSLLVSETLTSLVFFHFYSNQRQKLTKV